MSDEEKVQSDTNAETTTNKNNNTIRYVAIAVIAIIITIALAFFILTFMGGNPFGSFGVPEASLRIDGYGETIYVYHEGGDPLDMNKMWASIGGFKIPPEQFTLLSSGGTKFGSGDIISIETAGYGRPNTLIVWYEDTQGGRELARGELRPQPTPTVTPIRTPVETQTMVPEVEQSHSQNTGSETGTVQIWPLVSEVTSVPTLVPFETAITFEVSTTSGEQPLTVQFRDTTQDCIVDRLWEFGDGGKSAERFTSHTYVYPGTYMATLSVTFCNGYTSPAAFQQIHVSPIAREDSYITGFKGGAFQPGGQLDFIVKNNVDIRVGGRLYPLQENDTVRIELISGGQGAITVLGNVIVDLTLPTSILYINEEEIARGSVIRINGISFSNLAVSNLSLHVSQGPSAEINGIVNGYNVISPNSEYGYVISNIGPDSVNRMIIDAREQRFVIQAGIKGITQVTAE